MGQKGKGNRGRGNFIPKMTDIYGQRLTKNSYIVRHTEVQQFLTCPRKWMFQSHNGLNLEQKVKNPNLSFGTIWHDVMENYYKAFRSMSPQHRHPEITAERHMEHLIETHMQELQVQFGERFGMEDAAKATSDADLLRAMFKGYVPWSQNEAEPKDLEFTVLDVERRFIIPISTPAGNRARGAYLAVKLDTVVERNGGLWVLEHKTAGKSTKVDDMPGLGLDMQIALQALALYYLSSLEYQMPVRGIIYNVARKQMPSSRVKSPLYGRTTVFKTMEELKRVNQYLYEIYRNMLQTTKLIDKFKDRYPNEAWRAAEKIPYIPQVYGNGSCIWGCPVRDVCESINRGEDVTDLLEMNMQPRDKSIMEVLEEEMEE